MDIKFGDKEVTLETIECDDVEEPVISLVDLIRQGVGCHSVQRVPAQDGFDGEVVLGLSCDGVWVPVFMEQKHFWAYADQAGCLYTHDLTSLPFTGESMEYPGTPLHFLTPAPTYMSARRRSGSTDLQLTSKCLPSARTVQSAKVKLDCERDLRLTMGSIKVEYTAFVTSDVTDVILSLGHLVEAGASAHILGLESHSRVDTTVELGYFTVGGSLIPVFAHNNTTWLWATSGQRWPVELASPPDSPLMGISMIRASRRIGGHRCRQRGSTSPP